MYPVRVQEVESALEEVVTDLLLTSDCGYLSVLLDFPGSIWHFQPWYLLNRLKNMVGLDDYVFAWFRLKVLRINRDLS